MNPASIEPCPLSGAGVHSWVMRASHACRKAGMTTEQAAHEIQSHITRRPNPASEIQQAVAKAFHATAANDHTGSRVWDAAPKWPTKNPEQTEAITASGFGLVDLWEASPIRWNNCASRTEEIIDALFPGNPLLCVGKTNSDFSTAPRESFRGGMSGCQLIVPSPMLTRTGKTQEGKESQHALSNTGNRRFLVIEQDGGTQDEQAAILLYLASSAPLVLAVHSGSRSIHGWFYCAGRSEDTLRGFMRRAVTLGADPRMWTRSQFTRMPGGSRDNGNQQTVYFFNPKSN